MTCYAKMKLIIPTIIVLASVVVLIWAIVGCHSCDNNGDDPTPNPEPTPILPLGTVIKTFPASFPGIGSIDLDGDSFWEYSRGYAELRKRSLSNGDLQEILTLDGRLTGLWAVCKDPQRLCWWASNPDWKNFESENGNFIKLGLNGEILQVNRVSDNWSKPPLIIRDLDYNADYEFEDQDGNKITIGLISTSDWHYSIRKSDFLDVENGYWEQYWNRIDCQVAGLTHAGGFCLAACDGDNPESGQYPIIEYRQPPRKQWAERTGRKIIIPGVWFSSLKAQGRSIWGRGINANDGTTMIYQISLGPL